MELMAGGPKKVKVGSSSTATHLPDGWAEKSTWLLPFWAPMGTPIASMGRGAGGVLHPPVIWTRVFEAVHVGGIFCSSVRFNKDCVALPGTALTPKFVRRSKATVLGFNKPKVAFELTVLMARFRI